MRIYEIDAGYNPSQPRVDFVDGQLGVLMTILQHFVSKNKPGMTVPTANVLHLMANAGFHLTYPELDSLIKSSDNLKQLLGNNYNANSITIGTETGPESEPSNADQAANTVDQMASRAATR
jgi:hypothetical protein